MGFIMTSALLGSSFRSNLISAAPWKPSTSYENITILVPSGSSTHDNGKVLCFPITTLEILLFFAINFITHVVTVVSTPGETTLVNVTNMVLALFFPTSGLMRGLNSVARRVSSGSSDLDKACRAGALCSVIRNWKWRPISGSVLPLIVEEAVKNGLDDLQEEEDRPMQDTVLTTYGPTWLKEDQRWWIYLDTLWSRSVVNEHWSDIHGNYRLPQGYSFAILPSTTVVVPLLIQPYNGTKHINKISSSHSKAKIIASTVQLLYAAVQLFLRSGDQFARYGFASPYFAVVPYAIMSFVNGIAHLVTPEYSALFMVDSPCMEEARQANGCFEGMVGKVVPMDSPDLGFGTSKLDQYTGINMITIQKFFRNLRYPWDMDIGRPRNRYSEVVKIIIESTNPNIHDEEDEDVLGSTALQVSRGGLFESSHSFELDFLSPSDTQEQDLGTVGLQRPDTYLQEQVPDAMSIDSIEPDETFAPKCYTVAPACPEEEISILQAIRQGSKLTIVQSMNVSLSPLALWVAMCELGRIVYGLALLTWSGIIWMFRSAGPLHGSTVPYHTYSRVGRFSTLFSSIGLSCGEYVRRILASLSKRMHRPTKLYIPSCPRFLRKDDSEYLCLVGQQSSVSSLSPLLIFSTQTFLAPLLSTKMIPAKPRPEKPITLAAITIQIFLAVFISSLAILPIGYYTHFSPASSTTIQQVVMMIWLGTGICIGLIMPLFTHTDLLLLLLLSPYYSMIYGLGYAGMLPLGILVPPIWGLVEVWLMLSEHCVGLY